MDKVAVQKCNTYKEEVLSVKVQRILELLGGIDSFVEPGQKVLLKVNMLMGKSPAAAVTTHPGLVKVVARLVQEAGGKVIIGDSPGGPFTERALQRAYMKCGFKNIAREIGVDLNYDTEEKRTGFSAGSISKFFILAKYITEADVIINLPKLKTHGMTMYTGAVKNLFGAIPGLLKAEYHLKMPEIASFTQMLIDLSLAVKPSLNIIDAVIGMEGEGPSGGESCKFGYLMGSASAFALDVTGVYLMGIKPLTKVPLIEGFKKRKFISEISEVDLTGDTLNPAINVKIPAIEQKSNLVDQKMSPFMAKLINHFLRPRPVFRHDKCTGCGICYESCPPQTIEMINERPVVNLDDCIRCFCCQELCQFQAVKIKRPLLSRLFFR